VTAEEMARSRGAEHRIPQETYELARKGPTVGEASRWDVVGLGLVTSTEMAKCRGPVPLLIQDVNARSDTKSLDGPSPTIYFDTRDGAFCYFTHLITGLRTNALFMVGFIKMNVEILTH
jgi:hypothetical protein